MSTPYEAPTSSAPAPTPAEEVDPADARPGVVVGMAGFFIVCAGLGAMLVWPQLVVFEVRIWSWMKVLPPIISLLGLLVAPVGAFVAMGRFFASIAATVLVGLVLLFETVWTLWVLSNSGLSFLYPVAILFSLLGLVGCVVSLPLNLKITKARKALMYGP